MTSKKIEKNSNSVTILAKEILSKNEGATLTRSQILDYVFTKVDKDYFTSGMIARGIANIEKDFNFSRVEYGVYKKLTLEEKEKLFRDEANKILKDTCDKLEKVILKSDSYIRDNISKPSDSLTELRIMLETTEYIKSIISNIKNNIKE